MLLGKTCHKKRIGETSDVSHLQTFGCKGFVLDKTLEKTNFKPNRKRQCLLVIPILQKGRRCGYMKKESVLKRNVQFMNYLSHAYLKSLASDDILKDYYFYDDKLNKEDVKIDDSLSINTNCEIQEETIGS